MNSFWFLITVPALWSGLATGSRRDYGNPDDYYDQMNNRGTGSRFASKPRPLEEMVAVVGTQLLQRKLNRQGNIFRYGLNDRVSGRAIFAPGVQVEQDRPMLINNALRQLGDLITALGEKLVKMVAAELEKMKSKVNSFPDYEDYDSSRLYYPELEDKWYKWLIYLNPHLLLTYSQVRPMITGKLATEQMLRDSLRADT